MEELKYPIGHFKALDDYSHEDLENYISIIESFPKRLKLEVENLTNSQLDVPYRPDGWSVIQVVNHCADSHMNALIRVKMALTEETPIIKPYRQELWAELADGSMPIHFSLNILEGVHARWAKILRSLDEKQWKRGFIHPEKGKELSLKEAAASYAWHCQHHLAHITNLKKRMLW
ncbi:metal-dependent hydrolase [Sphingobacteriaceae bacterium]|nr:metal-dependent hydrolase [Sphingobacteriaceae bacterium]